MTEQEKKIQPMAIEANEYDCKCDCENCWRFEANDCAAFVFSKTLYKRGYRKADEVRKEQTQKILRGIMAHANATEFTTEKRVCNELVQIIARIEGVEVGE